MQQRFPINQNSYLMKLTAAQRTKARRKLIGSIILLLIALIILLNITAKINLIKHDPIKIVVATHPTQVPAVNESANTQNPHTANQVIMPNVTTPNVKLNTSATIAASSTESKTLIPNQLPNALIESSNLAMIQPLQPRIVIDTHKTVLSPADILSGRTTQPSVHKYYIHIHTSNDKASILHLQQQLLNNHIDTTIQSIHSSNDGVIYRLRVGPLKSKLQALKIMHQLTQLNNATNLNN